MTADGRRPRSPHQRQNFLGGFKLTLEHLGRPPVTRQYPEEKRPKQPRQHGRHVLNRYEDGMEKCIGCELCAGVCPADCIYVRGLDNPPDHPVSPGERYGYVYEINFLRCIHCDLCVEACPTEAITETKLMEFSFTNRNDAIYTKDELLVDDDGRPQHLPWEDWREGDDLHTSGWMRATSPSGSAEFEGQVQWSGELGYGVRAPRAARRGLPRRRRHREPSSCATPSSATSSRPTCRRPSAVPAAPSAGCWRRPSGSPREPARSTGRRRTPTTPRRWWTATAERDRPGPVRARPRSPAPARSRTARRPDRAPPDGRPGRSGARPRCRRPAIPRGSTWVPSRSPPPSCCPAPSGWWWPATRSTPPSMLVMTLFGVAVLFVLQRDRFLAAVQVIVYAGAIVVLFLFVIMFLGVDREENIAAEPLRGQRPLAVGLVVLGDHRPAAAGPGLQVDHRGTPRGRRGHRPASPTCYLLGKSVYTTYLFPFEATAALLIIAVVGAVVLARRPPGGRPDWRRAGRRRYLARRPRCPTSRPTLTRPTTPSDGRPLAAPDVTERPKPTGRPDGPRRSSMTINPDWYLALAAVLFAIGALGVLVRRNVLVMFMCVELMLNAANLTFVTFARMLNDIGGQVLVFFVLVVAAAEVVVGLGIVVAIFRRRANATADDLHVMKG